MTPLLPQHIFINDTKEEEQSPDLSSAILLFPHAGFPKTPSHEAKRTAGFVGGVSHIHAKLILFRGLCTLSANHQLIEK